MAKSALNHVTPLCLIAALRGYIEVAHFVGADACGQLRAVGIAPSALDDQELWVASDKINLLLENTAAVANCPHFALLMVEARGLADLGPLSLLLAHQPDVRGIMTSLCEHQRQMNDILMLSLEEGDDCATFLVDMLPGYATRQYIEGSVASAFRAIGDLMAGRWKAERVHFRHSAPADLSAHRRIFHCPVEFNSDRDGISCASWMLDQPTPSSHPSTALHALKFLSMLSAERPKASIIDRTRHAINLHMHSAGTTIDRIAESLGIHPRALQRTLDREGTSFGALLNEARRELALRYLITSNHSISEISGLLGYCNQSSFTRWFASEFGASPGSWRDDQLQATQEIPLMQGESTTQTRITRRQRRSASDRALQP